MTYTISFGTAKDPEMHTKPTGRYFYWDHDMTIRYLVKQMILIPRLGQQARYRMHTGNRLYWIIIGGNKFNVQTHVIRENDGLYIETPNIAPVFKKFQQAYRYLKSLRPPQLPREIVKPILPASMFALIEETILDFWQAIKELDTTRGFGNVGMILAGPPGVGKSETMRWLAEIAQSKYDKEAYRISMMDLSKMLASSTPLNTDRGLILIDDIDANILRSRKTTNNPMTSCFLSCLDGLDKREGRVILVSTNEDIDDVDPALLRPGRFDHIVTFQYPNFDLIRQFCMEREIELSPELFEGWSFARIDMFCAKFRVAHYRHGTEMPVFYEKFISEMGQHDPTVEACQPV